MDSKKDPLESIGIHRNQTGIKSESIEIAKEFIGIRKDPKDSIEILDDLSESIGFVGRNSHKIQQEFAEILQIFIMRELCGKYQTARVPFLCAGFLGEKS